MGGHVNNGPAESKCRVHGPIGLLLKMLAEHNMQFSDTMVLVTRQMREFNIVYVPWQDLKVRYNLAYRRERFHQMSIRRSDFDASEMIDHTVLDGAMALLTEEERKI